MCSRLLLITSCLFFTSVLHAQVCNYLLYDGFEYNANQPSLGLAGGVGWASVWDVQNANNTLAGYQSTAMSLSFGALQYEGGKMQGGQSYLSAGRLLDVSASGPFSSYLNNNGMGSGNLYLSFLMNKIGNNNQEVWAGLHTNSIAWCNGCSALKLDAGYFGGDSDSAGQRWWSIRLNNTVYKTNQAVIPNTPVFFVIGMQLGATNTFDVYVNPTSLGNTIPASPSLSLSNTSAYGFRSFATYLGDGPNQGAIDEVRMASTFPCVAPDNTITVNTPPVSSFTMSSNSGTIPFSSTFDASSSYDPGGSIVEYTWNFGDGSAVQHGMLVNHTFQTLGSLTVSLTVRDNNNVSHTSYQQISCLNTNGSFKCPIAAELLSMANCNGQSGSIQVNNTFGQNFQLRNESNQIIPPNGSGVQFVNLPSGNYNLEVSGANGCADTLSLYVPIDSAQCAGWQPNPCDLQLGFGLEGISYYSHGRVFTDYFKNVGEWVTYPIGGTVWSTNEFQTMPKDSNGYPLAIPFNGDRAVRGVISANGFLPVGKVMRLLYDGEGTIQMQGGVYNVSAAANHIDFTVANDGNIWFNMPYSNALNRVRNIRLVEIEDTATYLTQPFQQDFLDKISYFKCLRFMDWQITNGNENRIWAERSKPTYYSQSITPHGGVAYEYIIALANTYKKDIWINIPHLANDEYIEHMALLFKNNLHPGIHVYLEYSNEVWNWQFTQAHYVADSTNQSITYPRRYVERAAHAYRLWHAVWANQTHRVTRIMGLQLTNNFLNREIMAHANPNDYDALSPSFYFGLDYSNAGNPNLNVLGASATPQDIVANATNGFLAVYPLWEAVYRDAKMFRKAVINYEGGQHFTNFSIPPFLNAMYDAQYIPEMYTLYDRVLDSLNTLGSSLAMAFTLSGPNNSIYGSWGHLLQFETPAPFTAIPKFQVLLDHVNEKPNALFIGEDSVKAGQVYGYKVAIPQSGESYVWSVLHGTILSGQSTDSIRVQFTSYVQDTILLTVTKNGCSSQFMMPIHVNQLMDGVIHLRAFIEGYFNSGTQMMLPVLLNQNVAGASLIITDTIVVQLYSATSSPQLVQEVQTLLSDSGWCTLQFTNVQYNSAFYLQLLHRTALPTWSQLITCTSDTMVYDFTTAVNQAFGSNQVEVASGVYALYSGDLQQDGSIDAFDYLLMDQDIVLGNSGYLVSDINGDGAADAFDYLIIDDHIVNGISVNAP